MSQPKQLMRRLSTRHIRFIALGSAIGTGLFLGSSSAIQAAGPAVLLAYMMSGAAVFLVMRALGEMAVHRPVAGSFSQYAYDYLGPMAGFITGWTYIFEMVIVPIADVTAIGGYMGYWFPGIPPWIWVLGTVLLIAAINLMSVRVFGELEFWFSLLKVITIFALIAVGLGLIIFGIGSSDGKPIGVHNLWAYEGGFFAKGWDGLIMSLTMVMFAFGGIEVIGTSAGEAGDPQRAIPRAINSVPLRILVFYIGTLFVLMCIYPWPEIGNHAEGASAAAELHGSPFVNMFKYVGIKYAASMLNIVVITAAISAVNSDIFGAGRMMYGMAEKGHAPKIFGRLSRNGVPWVTVITLILSLLVAIVLNALIPERAFALVAALGTFETVWVWVMILLAQMGMRRTLSREEVKALKFPVPGYPVVPILAIVFMLLTIGLMTLQHDTRLALCAGGIWLVAITVIYWGCGISRDKKVVAEKARQQGVSNT